MFILILIVSRSIVLYFFLSILIIKESLLGIYFKKGIGSLDKLFMILVLIIIIIILIILFKYKGILMIIFIFIVVSLLVLKCIKEFGGIFGDVVGFVLVMGEVIGILMLGIF